MQVFLIQRAAFPHASLNREETKHCIRVLRHQVGDEIWGTDGAGAMYRLRIVSTDLQMTQLEIVETHSQYGEHTGHITLAVSPLRLKDRFEWLIEKAVELGVNEIQPLQCARTDVYKSKFKPERIKTLIETALKQCKRSELPMLRPKAHFEEWVGRERSGGKYVGWCEAEKPMQRYQQEISKQENVTLLIGPEGDFTGEEIQMTQSAGFQLVSLGENRLRTETAGIFALSMIKVYWGY
ncbi:MAG: RsmE family RNA methyltransferase [Bacteroidota bacterium]